MSFVDTQIDIVLSKDTSVNGSKKWIMTGMKNQS
jgi:hypothetical protein